MTDEAPNADQAKERVRGAAKGEKRLTKADRKAATPAPDANLVVNRYGLPEGCPVIPLGQLGKVRFYLDSAGQLEELAASDHGNSNLKGLFGREIDFIRTVRHWCRISQEGIVTGIRPEAIADDFFRACGQAGIFDPTDRKRERGAWRGPEGELVLHNGDQVMTCTAADPWGLRQLARPGLVGKYVYPAGPPIVRPAVEDWPGADPVDELLTVLETWQWRRTGLDPALMLGWLAAAMIGGALDWRPSIWLTGGKGTGKSTLQTLIRTVLGAYIGLENTTMAGVYQTLGQQSLPVALDELESSEDNRRAMDIISLARLAASGGKMARGGDNHQARNFTLRSCFVFSSILVPPMLGADRSRLAFLELDELPAEAPALVLDEKRLAAIGAQMRRRLVQGWRRYPATLAWWKDQLGKLGHSKRAGDTFGHLLCCADLVLWPDGTDQLQAAEWLQHMGALDLAETTDDVRDEQQCLDWLLGQFIDPFRSGTRQTIGQWINRAAGRDAGDGYDNPKEAQRVLQGFGLRYERILPPNGSAGRPTDWLAVANNHAGLAALFDKTRWGSPKGMAGVWTQALRRLPGAERSARSLFFGGPVSRATLLPLQLVPKPDANAGNPLEPTP